MSHVHEAEDSVLLLAVLPAGVNASLTKPQQLVFFPFWGDRNGQADPKIFIWKYRGPRLAKTILKKKNKVGGISSFKTYWKAAIIKMAWQWPKDRLIDRGTELTSRHKPSPLQSSDF